MMKTRFLLLFALVPLLVFSQHDTACNRIPQFISPTVLSHYSDSLENAIIDYSVSFLRTPYRYGGQSRKGIDCSGFVSGVYNKFGVTLPHSSKDMIASGRPVELGEVHKGDLLFFRNTNHRRKGVGHVAIVTDVKDGNIVFIHSARVGGVRFDNLSTPYYLNHYFRAVRLSILDSVSGK